jgi:hypothetical protein
MVRMTVHETWGSGRPIAAGRPRGERVRAVAALLERMLVGPAPAPDEGADLGWDVEPFPGPPAGSGHVRLIAAGSTDRPVVGASTRR